MRGEEHAGPPCGLAHLEEGLEAARGRIDLRQAVVIAPALPVVLDEDGVTQAVLCSPVEILRRLAVAAAPLIEADTAEQAVHAGRLLEAAYGAVRAGRRIGALPGGGEHEAGVAGRFQRE